MIDRFFRAAGILSCGAGLYVRGKATVIIVEVELLSVNIS